jgi:excinuclease ABC subunit C
MAIAATAEQFERAAHLRDKLTALQQLRQDQSLFGTSQENRDYIGVAQSGKLIAFYILCEREGKIVNHFHFLFEAPAALTLPEQLSYGISYLYTNGLSVPKSLVMAEEPTDADNLKEMLTEQTNVRVVFTVPQRGDIKSRLITAQDNAAYQLKLESNKKNRRENGLMDLAQILSLPKIPKRIEAFDISNLGATNIVGASIVFIDGLPAKSEYRKYNINTPEGQDDFASMRELVYRRLTQKERPLPDLLLIDGGKGQLAAALDARALAKQEQVPMVSLAKKEELLFLPGKTDPIALDYASDALLLLTAIRDEVHRFVISFHRRKRARKLLS